MGERFRDMFVEVKGQVVGFLLLPCGSQELNQVFRLAWKCLYPLSHLAGPILRRFTCLLSSFEKEVMKHGRVGLYMNFIASSMQRWRLEWIPE